MKRKRSTLKDYFQKGAIPTAANFEDLIDSMLNQDEDGLSKLPKDPLHITTEGAGEGLINFYRLDQNNPILTWQIKQKPGEKSGFSIDSDNESRLFIESGTGNVGIGTPTPGSALHVNVPASANPIKALTLDVISFGTPDNARASYFLQVRDIGAAPPAGFTHFSIRGDGNVGIGTAEPSVSLEVAGDVKFGSVLSTPGRMHINGGEILYLLHKEGVIIGKEWGGNGNLTVEGNLGVTGNVSITGRILQEDWIDVGSKGAPGFENGWTNYGNPFNSAGYFKDSMGIVHLKGLVKGGTFGFDKTIFTLPAGYRPGKQELHPVITSETALGRLDISTDGKVVPSQGSPNWYSLDGVTFRARVETIITGPGFPRDPTGPTGPIGRRIDVVP